MSNPKISIIIPAFNSANHIEKCLDAILASDLPTHELIIVDDKSTDKTRDLLKKYENKPYVRAIYHAVNKGAAITRNDGARAAKGKYLVYFDSDIVVKKDCIKNLVEPMEQDPEIGMTQGALINHYTKKTESIGHFLTVFGFPYDINEEDSEEYKKPIPILGTRAVFSYRRELFKIMGGYDEDYIFHGEDTDISWRIWLTGHSIYYIPTARAEHYHEDYETKKIGHYAFYEGAKNQISNVIKNAPAEYVWFMLPLNVIVWLFLALKLLIQGRSNLAVWICKGIWWNIAHLARTLNKRNIIDGYKPADNKAKQIMFGPMNIKQFFMKGARWFFHV